MPEVHLEQIIYNYYKGLVDMAKKKIPDYSIIALANLDLEQHMTEKPLVIEGKQRVKWDVEEEEYHYVAKGTIHIPIEMYFSKPEEDEEPEIRRVIVAGKRKFDARLEELDEDELIDKQPKDYGLDEQKVRSETFAQYKSNISSR